MTYRRTWLRSSPVCCAFATERPKAKAIKAMIAAFIASKPETCFHKRRKNVDGRPEGADNEGHTIGVDRVEKAKSSQMRRGRKKTSLGVSVCLLPRRGTVGAAASAAATGRPTAW